MKPEPMTPEQIQLMACNDDDGDWNDLNYRECWMQGYSAGAEAIIAARDAQWEEMLSKQESIGYVYSQHGRKEGCIQDSSIPNGTPIYAAPVDQAAEIERMREALDSVATMSEEASVARYARRAVLGVKHDDR